MIVNNYECEKPIKEEIKNKIKEENTEVDDGYKNVDECVTDHTPKTSSSGVSCKCQKLNTVIQFIRYLH